MEAKRGSPNSPQTLDYPRGILGHRAGVFDTGWPGWDIFETQMGGQIIEMMSGLEYFLHTDAVGSTTMDTDNTGTVHWDVTRYPWGQYWKVSGSQFWDNFAGLGHGVIGGFYPARHREYNINWGRWLTPDPAGLAAANPSNPQSWNRYAYALNNPASLTDPSGLDPCNNDPDCEELEISLFGISPEAFAQSNHGGGGGGAYTLDGTPVPAGIALGASQAGAAVACPGNVCSEFGTDHYTGQTAYLEFTAGAGGSTGYLSTYDWTQGVNEVNGTFLSNVAYQAFLRGNFSDGINAQLMGAISALEAKGATDKQIHSYVDFLSTHYSSIVVNGGNADFPIGGFGFLNQIGGGCAHERCDLGKLGTLDFSHNNGFFHLDTSDPYGWGLFAHAGVDLILGNFAYYVIPR